MQVVTIASAILRDAEVGIDNYQHFNFLRNFTPKPMSTLEVCGSAFLMRGCGCEGVSVVVGATVSVGVGVWADGGGSGGACLAVWFAVCLCSAAHVKTEPAHTEWVISAGTTSQLNQVMSVDLKCMDSQPLNPNCRHDAAGMSVPHLHP